MEIVLTPHMKLDLMPTKVMVLGSEYKVNFGPQVWPQIHNVNIWTGVNARYVSNGLGNCLQQTLNGIPNSHTLDLSAPLEQVLSDSANTYFYGLDRMDGQLSLPETNPTSSTIH